MKLLTTGLFVSATILGGMLVAPQGESVEASVLHTGYQQVADVATRRGPATEVSQGMAITDHYAYVIRQRAGQKGVTYMQRVDLHNNQKVDMGNHEFGHGNDLTYKSGELFVVKTGGSNKAGANVNVYGINGTHLKYKRALTIKEGNRQVNVSANAWDDRNHHMIYQENNKLYVANSTNPYETKVHRVKGLMTDTARYQWAKTASGVSQGMTVDPLHNQLYYTRSYNLTPGKAMTMGNQTYIGSVNLNDLYRNKITAGSTDALVKYAKSNSVLEVEGLAFQHGNLYFNTNSVKDKGHWSTTQQDIIGRIK